MRSRLFIVASVFVILGATLNAQSPSEAPQTPTPSPAIQTGQAPKTTPPAEPQKPEAEPKKAEQTQALPAVTYDVVVSAPRMELALKEVPSATSVVGMDTLRAAPRGIAAEEAMALVPGVKVDNQADGERVHLSIRGQGLLTERGVRGIKVLLDGLPLNDPTGLAPDLFDVDWSTVSRIEVLRGPSSALYGGGASGGVINITTRDGGTGPASGEASMAGGTYDFWKGLAEVGGTDGSVNYRVSFSGNYGNGYRVHTQFDAANLYAKVKWEASPTFHLTMIAADTHFFNENAEGLNIDQLHQDPKMPNPDALTYDEYQRTHRVTTGVSGQWAMAPSANLTFSAYVRDWSWEESVPSTIQNRDYLAPGLMVQFATSHPMGSVTNHVTMGTDIDWQGIDDVKHPNMGAAVPGTAKVADQRITQRSIGVYLLDRLELGSRFAVTGDVRGDWLRNQLVDNLAAGGANLSGQANFNKATGRVGASFALNADAGLYGSWGQGFLPPTTEELSNNPAAFGGFNVNLQPATSQGEEFGVRGRAASHFTYDVTFFHLDTDNDFGRYRVTSRPLETFYQNAGSSRRYGIESSVGWFPSSDFALRAAYTWSDFEYTTVKSLFGTFANSTIPNSPAHQIATDLEYTVAGHWVIGVGIQAQSSWFVDQSNVASVDGYALVNPRISFRWTGANYRGEISLQARNVFGTHYVAFTEPDPDGNSYQPGPTQEVFLGMRIGFGK